MPMRVFNDQEFWRQFKYDQEPAWLEGERNSRKSGTPVPFELDGDARRWFEKECRQFDFRRLSVSQRKAAEFAILECGEQLGLVTWEHGGGRRAYYATDRLITNWEILYPAFDPGLCFGITFDAKPDSVVVIDDWL